MRQDPGPVGFDRRGGPDVSQAAPGFVNPNFTKYADADRGIVGEAARVGGSTGGRGAWDGLVASLFKTADVYLRNEINIDRQEAYLRGQVGATVGLAEDEVKSNIFTKDWSTAGYNDTKTRLAMADMEAQTALDMKKLREQSPEAMNDYLSERRLKMLPLQVGMSLPARTAMLGQLALSDQMTYQFPKASFDPP